MAFGILEDKHTDHVPGTTLLSELSILHGHAVIVDAATRLKRGTGRHAHVVLNPQPSDDPADPLNWPRWKKEACFWTLAFAASLDGALSPMTGPSYVLLSGQFNTSVDDVASSFGAILLGLGCFMFVQGSFAVKFGHRIVYLCSVSLVSPLLPPNKPNETNMFRKMFIACIWCAVSPSLASIRGARVFQGFGMSALQSLVASTIEQIYFIHERGTRSVIWSFSIMAGITLGPFIYGYVVQNLTWQLGFWFVSIPLGICTLLVFFFVPETTYSRQAVTTGPADVEKDRSSPIMEKAGIEEAERVSSVESGSALAKAPNYLSQLKIWHGTFSDEPLWRLVLRPLPFMLSPVTVFLFLCHGLQTAWLSLLPICSSTIFTLEYGFNPAQIGLTNLGGLVGIVLALFVTSKPIDWSVVAMARRNGGVYEPEFRLVFMLAMLFGVFGYAGWAVGTTHNMPWIGAVACMAMANFSMVVSGAAAVTYLLDAHGPNALHCLAVSNFLKNMVLYGFSFFANGMIAARGVKVSLLILAACQAACWSASVPMYLFGKRARAWISRHPEIFTVPDS
ncbi:MFS general substrate transporter [Vararia minispora EC-137]|uniref:MFS general substrate transporter n=1 Tax=Vararia minispora EC-137 TaxID=1314806 RepID=A0ACB8QH31_9AGAM|nr:MFS general substrate transporter [Vararia minispora EC-137]